MTKHKGRELLQACESGPKFEIEVLPAQEGSHVVGIFEDGQICQRVGPFASEVEARRAMDDIKADWRRKTGNEGFYIGEDGKKTDSGLFDDTLDNPEADHYWAVESCADAFQEGGHNEESLLRIYGCTLADVHSRLEERKKKQ